MDNELQGLAEGLANTVNGKGGFKIEQIVKLLSTDSGKKILAMLMSDGGERVKRAAQGAKGGDLSGVQGIVASIAETPEGRALLSELMNGKK